MSDFNIKKFLAESADDPRVRPDVPPYSPDEPQPTDCMYCDGEDPECAVCGGRGELFDSEIISGYDPRLIAQDMIDSGFAAISDANFDDMYAEYMGRNGDPATVTDHDLKEAVRKAYKAILKKKARSGSDFNALPESDEELAGMLEAAGVKQLKGKDKIKGKGVKGYDQAHPTKGKFVGEGEESARAPTDQEYDLAVDQLSTVSDFPIASIGVEADGTINVMDEQGDQYEVGFNQITYMGNEFSEGLEEDIVPYEDGEDGEMLDDETGQIFSKDDVVYDEEKGVYREKTAQEQRADDRAARPEYWAQQDAEDAEAEAEMQRWRDNDYDIKPRINKLDPVAISMFGDIAGGGGDAIDYLLTNEPYSIEDLDAEARAQGYEDAHEWMMSFAPTESVDDDPWALGLNEEPGDWDHGYNYDANENPYGTEGNGYDDYHLDHDEAEAVDENPLAIASIASDLLSEYGEDEFERGDDWGDEDEYGDYMWQSVRITGDLPPYSYWNKRGKYQTQSEELEALIPAMGEVEDAANNPALEKFRRLGNIYHDVYNNGLWDEGHGQRGDEMQEVFGLGPNDEIDTMDLEDMVHSTIEAAWLEQKGEKLEYVEETMSGAFATGPMVEDDEDDEFIGLGDKDFGDDITLTPGQLVRIDSKLGGEAAVVAQRDNYIVVNLPKGGMKLLRNDEWWLEDHEDSEEFVDVDYDDEEPQELQFEGKKKVAEHYFDKRRADRGFGRTYRDHQHSHEEDKRIFKRQEMDHELGHEAGINNYAIFIGGKHWKTVKNERHAAAIVKTLKGKGKDAEYRFGAFPMNEADTDKIPVTKGTRAWMKKTSKELMPDAVKLAKDDGGYHSVTTSDPKKIAQLKADGYKVVSETAPKHGSKSIGQAMDRAEKERKRQLPKARRMLDKGSSIESVLNQFPAVFRKDLEEGESTHKKGYKQKGGGYNKPGSKKQKKAASKAGRVADKKAVTERWTDEDDGDWAYDNWKDKEMERDIEAGYKSSKEAKKAKRGGSWNAPRKVEEAPRSNQAMFNRFGMKKLADFIKANPEHPDIKMAKSTLRKKKRDAAGMKDFRAKMKAKGTPLGGTKYKHTSASKHGGDDQYSWAVFDKKTGQPVITGLTKPEVKHYRDKIERDLAKKYEAAYKPELEPGEEILDELLDAQLTELETATDKLDAERAPGEATATDEEPTYDELAGMQEIMTKMMQEPNQDMEDAIQAAAHPDDQPAGAEQEELGDQEMSQLKQLLGLLK